MSLDYPIHPTTVSLNYTNIDTLSIIPGTLGSNAGLPGEVFGQNLDIDNIVYNQVRHGMPMI